LGYELEDYPKYFEAATGVKMSLDDMWRMGDRVYALIRAFWAREYGEKWGRMMDYPPVRWFKHPLPKGPLKGQHLDMNKYEMLLTSYYNKRGWDERGIPTKNTLKDLDLTEEAEELDEYVKLN
jgi:aldehyde:ferredoxin oxidoreductase